ncbi:MAG: stage II sporulation protein E [Christensenellaceae bacterium]|nr:stage II sporulation protein E [Christensenellaceae bacterium]
MSQITKEKAARPAQMGISGKKAAFQLAVFAAGFLIGRVRISDGVWPFGTAFVLAAFLHERRVNPYMALGGVLAAMATYFHHMQTPAYNFAVLGIGSALMIIAQCLKLPKRVAVALLAAAVAHTVGLLAFKRSLMLAVLATLVELALCCLMIWVSHCALRFWAEGRRRRVLSDEEILSLVLVGLMGIMGLGELRVLGISLRQVLCVAIAVAAAFLGGAAVGGLTGIALALACVISGSDASLIGAYGFSAMVAGICKRLHRPGAAVGFFAGNVFLSFFAMRLGQLLIPPGEAALGAAVFLLIPRGWLQTAGRYVDQNLLRAHEQKLHRERFRELTTGRLQEISQVFLNASRIFADSAQKNREGSEIAYAISAIPGKACGDCLFCESCWERELPETFALMQKLYGKYEKNGNVTVRDLGTAFAKKCMATDKLIAAARQVFEKFSMNSRFEAKIAESRAMVGDQLEGVSRVIGSLLKEVEVDIRFRPDLEDEIRLKLDELGVDVREVSAAMVGGALQVSLRVQGCRGKNVCTARMAAAISKACGRAMWVARETAGCPGRRSCTLRFEPARALRVNYGVARVKKEGSPVSGDACSFGELGDGRYMALLCDGMGSGERAARESAAAVSLMEDFYRANFDDKTVLDAINKLLLLSSSDEIFSTIDLCMVDLVTGHARFTKIGAPHSYLLHGGSIRRLQAGTLPMGILDEFHPAVYETDLEAGDLILLFSDGVADLENSGELLFETITQAVGLRNAQEIAERILTAALAMCGGTAPDDMTVMAVRLVKNKVGPA